VWWCAFEPSQSQTCAATALGPHLPRLCAARCSRCAGTRHSGHAGPSLTLCALVSRFPCLPSRHVGAPYIHEALTHGRELAHVCRHAATAHLVAGSWRQLTSVASTLCCYTRILPCRRRHRSHAAHCPSLEASGVLGGRRYKQGSSHTNHPGFRQSTRHHGGRWWLRGCRVPYSPVTVVFLFLFCKPEAHKIACVRARCACLCV
jgi:hypothetical protein